MAHLFTAIDPRGRAVTCSDDLWQRKILVKHAIMKGLENEVKKTVEKPDFGFIYQDADREDRNIYYRMYAKLHLYIKVVAEFNGEGTGRVVSAFITDSPKAGEKLIWPQSKD